MPRYPVEESLLREPNLWVPGKKPVGPVKIDPSFQYKVDSMILYESRPNIIAGSAISANYVNVSAGDVTGFGGNIGVSMGGAANGYSNQDLDTVMNAHGDTGTVIIHYYVISALSDWSPLVNGEKFQIYAGNVAGQLRNLIGSNVWTYSSSTAWDIGEHVLVINWGHPTLQYRNIFINGSLESSTSSNSATSCDSVQIDVPRQAGGNPPNKQYYSFSYFRDSLPDKLCASLSLDPYQFLIPA